MIVNAIISKLLVGVVGSLLFIYSGTVAIAQRAVVVSLSANAQSAEKIAADELIANLRLLYPSVEFRVGTATAETTSIYLGTAADLPEQILEKRKDSLDKADSFLVDTLDGRDAGAVIVGASPRATLYAVDALLEKLGYAVNCKCISQILKPWVISEAVFTFYPSVLTEPGECV